MCVYFDCKSMLILFKSAILLLNCNNFNYFGIGLEVLGRG